LAAIEASRRSVSSSGTAVGDAAAISLIDDVPMYETKLVAMLGKAGLPATKAIEWADVVTIVLPMGWIKTAKPSAPGLEGMTPSRLPEVVSRLRTDPDVLIRQLGIVVDSRADA